MRNYQKKVRIPQYCEKCGCEFHPLRNDARFCSSRCQKAHKRSTGLAGVVRQFVKEFDDFMDEWDLLERLPEGLNDEDDDNPPYSLF